MIKHSSLEVGSLEAGKLIKNNFTVNQIFHITYLWFKILRAATTELWEFENGQNNTLSPTFSHEEIAYAPALFLVNADFCQN